LTSLLKIIGLSVELPKVDTFPVLKILTNLDLEVRTGEIHGLVGETGAGKSMTIWSTMGLLPGSMKIVSGEISFDNQIISAFTPKQYEGIRGKNLAIISQNPFGSLNPIKKIGKQLVDFYRQHNKVSSAEAMERVLSELQNVGIPDPEKRFHSYPSQLSGGMAQRVLIAAALINRPKLLLADEPTTGLDVTIQAQILRLLKTRCNSLGTSVLFITHDLGVIAQYCDRVSVMFAGNIVETGSVQDVFLNPQHPYTRQLLDTTRPNSKIYNYTDNGLPPDLTLIHEGCNYNNRCQFASDECKVPLTTQRVSSEHSVRCHKFGRLNG
jgi:peptide/nickel transport system ATP-binding protein/oligopeptide transport system ATP-binding protein